MNTRRDFLKSSALGAGAMMLPASLQRAFAAPLIGQPPMRFIFMSRQNGLYPDSVVPPSLSNQDKEKEKNNEAFEANLDKHELPKWMSSLAEHKENMTILRGVSGMMCTTSHATWQSSIGVYKATSRESSLKWATIDFELAKLFPSALDHVALACFPLGRGGAPNGIDIGYSARAAQQANYAFGSPKIAIDELFRAGSNDESGRIRSELDRLMFEFSSAGQNSLSKDLLGSELTKVRNYANAIDDIRSRNKKLEAMSDVIRKNIPKLEKKYLAADISTVDRQVGHVEVLLSCLIAGMTNVVTFTLDQLGTRYSGVPGFEDEAINLHDVGHHKAIGGINSEEVRDVINVQHMSLIDRIVKRLKSVPEGNGTMMDNTTLLYYPDNGEAHHSKGTEYPFIIMSGRNSKLDIAGRYIRLPSYGQKDHATLGNLYTTLLNAYGNPIKHYGQQDVGLDKFRFDQTGPIKPFIC